MQNDPDKVSNMPKDGTVHELTSNVSNVIEFRFSVSVCSELYNGHIYSRIAVLMISFHLNVNVKLNL